ncbi:MAG: class I SAM-dependent methyltransferase [Flavobacteriales bacterium]|nr:class I SAM-dependent methyltransferase [Flavobacteriales bacterium]
MTWFTNWFGSPYYKLLYGHRNEQDARPWVEGIVRHLAIPKGSRVLDLGCGRGRHAHWFIEAGMQVTGLDLSPESIAEARASEPKGEFHVQDMRQPFGVNTFDLVVCLFTSLGYGEDREDDQQVLNNALAALRPGGWFILDFMNTVRIQKGLVPAECVLAQGVRFHVMREIQDRTVVKLIDVDDGGACSTFQERVHAWLPEELTTLVARAGGQVIHVTDAPPFAPFDRESSDRVVIWSQRPTL